MQAKHIKRRIKRQQRRHFRKITKLAKQHDAKFGFFSQRAFDANGGCIYETICGREIVITTVTNKLDYEGGWKDLRYVGLAKKFIRRAGIGSYKVMEELEVADTIQYERQSRSIRRRIRTVVG